MATISIKLKAILNKEEREKIQNAHIVFNEGVRKFEEFLLLAQCKDYYYDDNLTGEEKYYTQEMADEALDKYIKDRYPDADADVCTEALKKLPEVIRNKKSQAANSLLKLYNKNYMTGMKNFNKIVDPEPEWMHHYDTKAKCFDDEKHRVAADEWIESEEGKNAIAPSIEGSGRPSSFKSAFTQGKEWYGAFVSDQQKYRKDLQDGLMRILFDLDNQKVFPLIDIPNELVEKSPKWVQLYLKTALENYASYLECDAETRENYINAVAEYEGKLKYIESEHKEAHQLVDKYLKENYIEGYYSPYLTDRMCRGITSIRIEWKNCKTYEQRIEILNKYQADKTLQRKIGDVNFLRWLAEDEHIALLDGDTLDVLLDYYASLRNKEQKRKCASYTVADPISSKRYLFASHPCDSNYKKYNLEEKEGKLYITFPILTKDDKGNYTEENLEFQLAANNQFQPPYIYGSGKEKEIIFEKGDKKISVQFSNGKKLKPSGGSEIVEESFVGMLGGADLRVENNASGKVKEVYISIPIEVDEICAKAFEETSSAALYHYSTAYTGTKSKYDNKLQDKSLRALSIDLGLKQFAAAAVGQAEYMADPSKLQPFEIERMFMLRLPGEKNEVKTEKERSAALAILRGLRAEINYLSMLKRIYNIDDKERRDKLIQRTITYTSDLEKQKVYQYCLKCSLYDEVKTKLDEEYDKEIQRMNMEMSDFRSSAFTKKQKRAYAPGKTFWSIAYLEELRKVLMSWNSLPYHISDENIIMSKEYGVTATRLLEHINHIKDDRIKSGADLIVQSARGYIYDESLRCWVQKYEPCHVIIFEDLSRYRFKTDRPRQENSKLMQWAHREIINETERQAALYGISVYSSTDAAFSSKFHYKSKAPGIRCDRLSGNDFDLDGKLKDYVLNKLPEQLKDKVDAMKPGDIIPSEIGSIFVTVNGENELSMINADLNAACNLQSRFWERHTHMVRVKTVNRDGELYINGVADEDDSNLGKRQSGQYKYHYGTTKVILQGTGTYGHYHILPKKKGMNPPKVDEKIRYVLFNDPSGLFFKKDEWIGYNEFWDHVNDVIISKLTEYIK